MSKVHFKCKVEEVPTSYARAIRREQIKRNLSNEDLAKLCGLSVRSVYRLITGSSPRIETLEKILFELDLELTAQPIGADFKEELENGKR